MNNRHDRRVPSDLNTKEALAMDTTSIVVPPGQDPASPGALFSLKLGGEDSGGSVMAFEETTTGGKIS